MEDSRGDLFDQHWDQGSRSWSDVAKPWEWSSRGELGVRGESCRLHVSKSLDQLRWGGKKEPRPRIPKDGKIGGECGSLRCPRRDSEDGLERHPPLFHKHTKNCFAEFQAAKVGSMPFEEAICLLEPLKSSVGSLLRGGTPRANLCSGEEAETVHLLGGRTKNRAQS